MKWTPPPQVEDPAHTPHPRVIEQAGGGCATVTILPPRNLLRLDNWAPLIFPIALLACAAAMIATGNVGTFALGLFAAMFAWFATQAPDLLRGFHTRVELVVDPDELRATTRYAWATRQATYRRDQVLGVRIISTDWRFRALHVRFKDAAPLEFMLGYPDDQLEAAAGAVRTALAAVPPRTPLLHADGVATLPYAAAGPSYEVAIERLTDGVSVRVPAPPRNTRRAIGGVLLSAMMLVMLGTWARWAATKTGRAFWAFPVGPVILLLTTWGLVIAIRDFLRRDKPLLIALTRRELLIENGPWFRSSRRIPREEIKSISLDASGQHRTMVLRISAKRDIELMPEREADEIQRVAEALNEA